MEDKYTRLMSELSVNMKYEDLPDEVIEQVKKLTMLTLGVSLGAYPIGVAKRAIGMTKEKGGKKESTILADGAKVPMEEAAFVNATMADCLDWEDCTWTGHASAGAIPTALAVSEANKASGKDYITAVVAGYEVYQRIAMAVQASAEYRKEKNAWGLVSWQIYSCVIPAAKLMGLDVEKTQQALGVALYQVNAPTSKHTLTPKSDVYHYAHGFCARDGITSALIAKSGIDGLYDSLDEPGCYANVISDKYDTEWYFRKGYLIMETMFKHWPANIWIQGPLDALDALIKENEIKAYDVKEITVSPIYPMTNTFQPEGYAGVMDAQFSVPFCLATLLLDPNPGYNWFTEERLTDPEILAMAGKIKGAPPVTDRHKSFALFQAGSFPEVTVTVTLNDNAQYVKNLQYPKGHARNKLTWDELKDRFRLGASACLKAEKVEKLIDAIENLDTIKDMSDFTSLLSDE